MVCELHTLWYTKQPMGFKRLNTAKWPPVCWLQTMSCQPFRKAFMPIPYKLTPHSCKTRQSFTKVQNGGQWDSMVKSHDGGGGDWADLKMVTKSCIRWIDFLVDSSACSISFWLAAWVCNKHYKQLGAASTETVRTWSVDSHHNFPCSLTVNRDTDIHDTQPLLWQCHSLSGL